MDRAQLFINAFSEAGGDNQIGSARIDYLSRFLDAQPDTPDLMEELDPEEFDEMAWSFESLAIAASRAGAGEKRVSELAERAFHLRAAQCTAPRGVTLYDIWMLVVSGVLAQKQPTLRLLLTNDELFEEAESSPHSWPERVWSKSVHSIRMLARKSRSWEDIEEGIRCLQELSEMQQEAESELFLSDSQTDWRDDKEKCKLLGLYHLAEALSVLGKYLRTGDPEGILVTLQRHGENARMLLGASGDIDLERVGESVEPLTTAMARSSIWFNTSRLSQVARQFAQRIAADERDNPVTELWWSQREALSKSLLDPFKTAISVQMPTSAGKTLLAEFSIVQTLALNPGSVIAYLVPTRALVNQMTRRLRRDLVGASADGTEIAVEAAVPVFELDPTEQGLLAVRPDVLVTTPEKLDLLVRADHPSVRDLSLVVVDEAHHIADVSRGPRLELLLATLKRERGRRCRFLLLTPFLPNAGDLASWLGEGEGAAIELNWKPSEQIRALGKWTRNRKKKAYHDALALLPSATQPSNWDGTVIDLGPAVLQPPTRQREAISTSLAINLSERSRGGTLILTAGPGTSEKRALQVSENLGQLHRAQMPESDLLEATIDYVETELGSEYPLARTLRQGVAFHHAGLPPEVRSLVELLLDQGLVRVVAGTSTLAQGVDFPLSSVIVETLTVPQGRGKPHRPLRYSEFWNIAGRAGRALRDSVGVVVYPSTGKDHDEQFTSYLEGEAVKVVSALLETIKLLDSNRPEYNLALVRGHPELSHFFQYLAHALKVGGFVSASAEVEEILRSSLVFHGLQADSREVAEKLVGWSRGFMEEFRSHSLLSVADVTGLSIPSVGMLSYSSPRIFQEPEFWHPDNLFGNDLNPLTQVIEVLAQIPEMSLAPTDEPGGINARRVAGVLRDWVSGKSLPEIADAWFSRHTGSKALTEAGKYLFREATGQLPWGIGALQLIELSGLRPEETSTVLHVPAMSFYGVNDVASLPMRMVGVPRAAAKEFGSSAPQFDSFQRARNWVSAQPASHWEAISTRHGFKRDTLRCVWEAVGGSA
ncbi:DEAD/DEAH box helicase [Streptomyces sp. NPDC057092]|uniref:DEAD/DEAH box helicase n=1 Tax=Streptomyces sp. NPDC057092 TaxID=3346017 RepID=UPI00363B9C97